MIDVLTDLLILRGPPAFVRSDNGPEFVAEAVRRWIAAVGARTAFIEPGSPWENGYIKSFNARFRDELLDGEIFYSLKEAQVVIDVHQHRGGPPARDRAKHLNCPLVLAGIEGSQSTPIGTPRNAHSYHGLSELTQLASGIPPQC